MPEPIPLPCPRERATELAAIRSWLAKNPVTVEACDVAPCEPVAGGADLSRVLRMILRAERAPVPEIAARSAHSSSASHPA